MEKKPLFRFRPVYFWWTLLLLGVEIYIGLYVRDAFIRPYGGDILVVALIYCFLKIFLRKSPLHTAVYVLIFAFCVEFAQYFKIVEILGLQDNAFARIIIGTSYAWHDLVAYFVGFLGILAAEYFGKGKRISGLTSSD